MYSGLVGVERDKIQPMIWSLNFLEKIISPLLLYLCLIVVGNIASGEKQLYITDMDIWSIEFCIIHYLYFFYFFNFL